MPNLLARRAALLLLLLLAACTARPAPVSTPASGAQRVFEIRTYTTHPGRLEALNRRFREHTTRLFEKHGMTNVGYWIPQDSALSHNTLVYVLAYPSRDAARQSWRAFASDPEWKRVQAQSEADGKIVSRVESVFMDPTDYSPTR